MRVHLTGHAVSDVAVILPRTGSGSGHTLPHAVHPARLIATQRRALAATAPGWSATAGS